MRHITSGVSCNVSANWRTTSAFSYEADVMTFLFGSCSKFSTCSCFAFWTALISLSNFSKNFGENAQNRAESSLYRV